MKIKQLIPVILVCSVFVFGCVGEKPAPQAGGGHDHDHDHGHEGGHHHPETFAEAVAEIAEMKTAIQTALSEGDTDKADGPVHEIGHILEELEELAKKAELSEEQIAEVKAATETLFASFAALDETIHGKEDGKSWDDVGEDINAAVTKLETLAAPEKEAEDTEAETEEPAE